MKKGSGREPGGGRSIAGAALILLLILLGVGAFTFHLYTRIVNESKTLAWEMTLKSAEVMELRLEDIRSSLAAFSRSVASSGAGPGEVGEMASRQLDGHPIFRLHVVTEEGAPLTEDYGLTAGDAARLEELCPEDGAFSAGYLGKSGRWQTAVAVSGTVAGVPCRFYAECVLDDLYMDDFMEFHSQQGYCYMISGGEGTFIMLPHNKFGQGLYSGLFTMLEAYRSNDPAARLVHRFDHPVGRAAGKRHDRHRGHRPAGRHGAAGRGAPALDEPPPVEAALGGGGGKARQRGQEQLPLQHVP